MEKICSNRVVKIGIVTDDADRTADTLTAIFQTETFSEDGLHAEQASYAKRFCRYMGKDVDQAKLKVRIVQLTPLYFEILQPIGEGLNPWSDYLAKRGTGVCFISFYIDGFEKHIDLMRDNGMELIYEEEKGYERYAYFDTLKKLGFLLEMKERKPRLADDEVSP